MKLLSAVKNKLEQNKTNIKILSAFIVCISLILLSSIGYSNKVDDTLKENKQITQEYENLIKDYNSVVDYYNSLYKQYDDLNNANSELQTQIQNYQDQQETINNLTAQLNELQNQYNNLKTENESLSSQVSSLQTILSQNNHSSEGNGWRIPGSISNSSDNTGGGMVWLSETGSKYHSIPNCGNMNPNNAWQVSQSSAEASGYSRCSKCF